MLGAYTDGDKKVHLSKGDVVEVLDTEKKTEWLVRKQSEKEKVRLMNIFWKVLTVNIFWPNILIFTPSSFRVV